MVRKSPTRNGGPNEFFVSMVRLSPLIFCTELHRGPFREPVTHLQHISHKLQFELWIFIGAQSSHRPSRSKLFRTRLPFYYQNLQILLDVLQSTFWVTCDSHRRVLARILMQSNIFNLHSQREIIAHSYGDRIIPISATRFSRIGRFSAPSVRECNIENNVQRFFDRILRGLVLAAFCGGSVRAFAKSHRMVFQPISTARNLSPTRLDVYDTLYRRLHEDANLQNYIHLTLVFKVARIHI
ncbi:unnamed protein product [Albugo candida]|uniref:Uncharacterized protein n=1 Tax=Albugo candida TaxID=65357 RepID=A0A024FW21_9STRA|nr:unnamed protein product [Albugo candida]|eukprot:CCI11358.1 unnamed protein product [Albugo candida]